MIYNPKIVKSPFKYKREPRPNTFGIIIKSCEMNYNPNDYSHAYIHLNGTIEMGQDIKMVASSVFIIISVMVNPVIIEDELKSVKYTVSHCDFLLASQLDALAYLCRLWGSDLKIINEAGDQFPLELLTKYINNNGFTRFV